MSHPIQQFIDHLTQEPVPREVRICPEDYAKLVAYAAPKTQLHHDFEGDYIPVFIDGPNVCKVRSTAPRPQWTDEMRDFSATPLFK